MNKEILLSAAANNAMPSGVRKMFELARKYPDAINLTLGEPGFRTPSYVLEAQGYYSVSIRISGRHIIWRWGWVRFITAQNPKVSHTQCWQGGMTGWREAGLQHLQRL